MLQSNMKRQGQLEITIGIHDSSHSNNRTIFGGRTTFDHSNTILVHFLDLHCIKQKEQNI